ncbi:MAG TPA: hypothetical protein VOA64_04825 [Candidatus Dormibacteraeota bacterium]|nr:hypothetical protein [Candidatus Dormibacteraeota bacterium]
MATLIKKTVGSLRVMFLGEDGQPQTAEGTRFFVIYPDKRGGDNFGFIYLVTNRHMARPGIQDRKNYPVLWTHVRLNLRNSDQGSEEGNLPIGGPLQWSFPADDSVDLAVLPLAPAQTKYDYVTVPIAEFAKHNVVDTQQVAEGDNVLFTGYFYQFPVGGFSFCNVDAGERSRTFTTLRSPDDH